MVNQNIQNIKYLPMFRKIFIKIIRVIRLNTDSIFCDYKTILKLYFTGFIMRNNFLNLIIIHII